MPPPPAKSPLTRAFTLIELSIVLVIIGLIIGGVLLGRDLISAAAVRAQISQIEKYNAAVNTFYVKYNCLPGDCANAAQFGFIARGSSPGQGDGNGILEGITQGYTPTTYGAWEGAGETVMFWVDLSTANLIEGGFNTARTYPYPIDDINGAALNAYFPQAKIGNGNYIYAYSDTGGINWFGIGSGLDIHVGTSLLTSPGLTVSQASSLDTKIDDGFPQSGSVQALYVNGWPSPIWDGANLPNDPTGPYSGSCYDNGNVTGAVRTYSLSTNNGNGINCALSFRMQGAGR